MGCQWQSTDQALAKRGVSFTSCPLDSLPAQEARAPLETCLGGVEAAALGAAANPTPLVFSLILRKDRGQRQWERNRHACRGSGSLLFLTGGESYGRDRSQISGQSCGLTSGQHVGAFASVMGALQGRAAGLLGVHWLEGARRHYQPAEAAEVTTREERRAGHTNQLPGLVTEEEHSRGAGGRGSRESRRRKPSPSDGDPKDATGAGTDRLRPRPSRFAAASLADWLEQRRQEARAAARAMPFWVVLRPPGHPDKRRLMTVSDFYEYTERRGKEFFDSLDRDADGQVSLEDMRVAMRTRNLPERYAQDFIHTARGGRWWSQTIAWEEFRGMMDEKEPKMLRAFTSMQMDDTGELKLTDIKGSLKKLGVPATDENAKAMIKALGAEVDGAVSYGRFRNFLMLLPPERLASMMDAESAWFEAATMMPLGPPGEGAGMKGGDLIRAALAGGIASSASTLTLHPLDTLKTRIQGTPGATVRGIASSAPSIGLRGLYRGIIPAAGGSFVSHGVRCLAYEAAFSGCMAMTGGSWELQAQALASAVGTVLGTCVRIPMEICKQRLQMGRHANILEAFSVAASGPEGARGLFRGTGALLSREVPFYVFGMVGYQQLKKVFNGEAFGQKPRELQHWQVVAIGALAGALASIATTPADVVKTRIMTASAAQAVSTGGIISEILAKEGVSALFRGALPRALWVAPLGAMNFAGYELAKGALKDVRKEHESPGGP